MTRRQKPRKRRSVAGRALRGLFLLLLFAAFFWSQQNIIKTEVIEVEGVPSTFDGISIALVSDVHGKEFGEGNRVLLEQTAQLRPDLIAITGDLIHDPMQLTMVPALAKGLSEIAPTYYVTGNHEWAIKKVPELKAPLADCGVTVLSNEYVLFEKDGEKLALLGADDNNGYKDQKTIAELAEEVRQTEGEDCYLLLLSHRNNRYETYAKAGVDLTLAGHAHGGQIRLPFTDGLIGPHREPFPQYTAGLYPLSYGQMVVSRGLSDKAPAFRLFNRPDLPLVVLRAEG